MQNPEHIAELQEKINKLQLLVKTAYFEGFDDGLHSYSPYDESGIENTDESMWVTSQTLKTLSE